MVEYIIYTLADPSTGEIFYVGRTINLKARLSNHFSNCLNSSVNIAKQERILKIAKKDILPVIEEIDSCVCQYVEDEEKANDLEVYWMFQLKAWGFNLTNITGLKHRTGSVHLRLVKRLPYKRPKLSSNPSSEEIKYFWKQRFVKQ